MVALWRGAFRFGKPIHGGLATAGHDALHHVVAMRAEIVLLTTQRRALCIGDTAHVPAHAARAPPRGGEISRPAMSDQ